MTANIMNLMMGTQRLQNTPPMENEVNGELFQNLLIKATEEGGDTEGKLPIPHGEEPVLEEVKMTDEEAIATLGGAIFSQVPLEMHTTGSPEKLPEYTMGLRGESGSILMKASEEPSIQALFSEIGQGNEELTRVVLDAIASQQADLKSDDALGVNTGDSKGIPDLIEKTEMPDTNQLLALRRMTLKDQSTSVNSIVEENESIVDRTSAEEATRKSGNTGDGLQNKELNPLEEDQKILEKEAVLHTPGNATAKSSEVHTVHQKDSKISESEIRENLKIAEDAVVRSVETMRDGDKTVMRLKLHPEELGEMELTLSMEQGKITGKLFTDSQEIRQIFQGKLMELQETLKTQNIQVVKLEVATTLSDSGQSFKENQAQHEMRHRSQEMALRGYPSKTERKITFSPAAVNSQEGISILA